MTDLTDLKASLQSAKKALDDLDAFLKSDDVVLNFVKDPQKYWIEYWKEKLKRKKLIENILEDIERRSDACLSLTRFPLKDAEDSASIFPPS